MHLQRGIAKGACAHFSRCPAHRPAVKRPAMPRPAAPSPRCQPMHAGIAPSLSTPAGIDSGTAPPAHSPCTAHSRARAPQQVALLPRCPCCPPLQLLPPHPLETQSAARSAAGHGTGRDAQLNRAADRASRSGCRSLCRARGELDQAPPQDHPERAQQACLLRGTPAHRIARTDSWLGMQHPHAFCCLTQPGVLESQAAARAQQ